MRFKILLLLVFAFTFMQLNAQTDTTNTGKDTTAISNDTTDVENWDSWDISDGFDFELNMFGDEFRGAPSIYLSYGIANINRSDVGSDFADPNSFELKLGKTYQTDFKQGKLLKYRFSYLFLSNVTTDLAAEDISGLKTQTWRFGIGKATGYGYEFGEAAIIPYNSNSFTWSRLDADESLVNFDGLMPVVDRYNNSIRFANTFEAGTKIQIIKNLGVDASYERTAVYERHLFWKWGGSILIELISQSLLDEFIEEIIDSSPYAGPIVNFVLKNALSYGMYELREEKMNWPFASAPALMYDQFKVGLTFVF